MLGAFCVKQAGKRDYDVTYFGSKPNVKLIVFQLSKIIDVNGLISELFDKFDFVFDFSTHL